jgi:cysteinyl-tRNA synthetase
LQDRKDARDRKDFKASDEIRKELFEFGVRINDTKGVTKFFYKGQKYEI